MDTPHTDTYGMRIPCELLAAPRKIQAGHHLEDTPLSMGIAISPTGQNG